MGKRSERKRYFTVHTTYARGFTESGEVSAYCWWECRGEYFTVWGRSFRDEAKPLAMMFQLSEILRFAAAWCSDRAGSTAHPMPVERHVAVLKLPLELSLRSAEPISRPLDRVVGRLSIEPTRATA